MKYKIKITPGETPRTWVLLEGITIEGVRVPRNFTFDGASIPRGLRGMFPHGGAKMAGAHAHDWLYRNPWIEGTREEADQVFYDAMISNGVSKWKAKAMYLGVRSGGWVTWGKVRRKR